jgi:MoaA/NifB/PqqE/SkfB family radical SAM enzyme
MTDRFIVESAPYVFAKDWHRKFPPMIVVSITNVCNERCIHCFYDQFIKMPGYKQSYLEWDLWEKICEETSHWPGVVLNFGTDGEPLMHPRFTDMLREARKNKISPINITTNGTLMNESFNKILVDEFLTDVINISIDAFTPESYRQIRGGNIGLIKKNVLNLIDYRNSKNSKIKIQVNIIDQPEVKDEIEDFKNFWTPLVDNVLIRTYYDATTVTGGTGPNITGKQAAFEKVKRWPCQQLWRRFNIADDGTARFCVDDWFNKTKIGDLREKTISEIWTSDHYNKIRQHHIKGTYKDVAYCAKCTEWQGMKWDFDYFTAMSKLLGKEVL